MHHSMQLATSTSTGFNRERERAMRMQPTGSCGDGGMEGFDELDRMASHGITPAGATESRCHECAHCTIVLHYMYAVYTTNW